MGAREPKYDVNPEHFLAWFVAVEERKELRQLSDQAAIIFATEALEGLRGVLREMVSGSRIGGRS